MQEVDGGTQHYTSATDDACRLTGALKTKGHPSPERERGAVGQGGITREGSRTPHDVGGRRAMLRSAGQTRAILV